MDGYTPGEQPQAGKFIKLNTNENPYPPPAGIRRAIEEVLERGLQKYPDPMANAFRTRAAELLGSAGEGLDSVRQRQRRHSDDLHAGVCRAREICCGCRIRATSSIARWPSFRGRGGRKCGSMPIGRCRRRLAVGGGRPEAGVSAESEQPDGDDG